MGERRAESREARAPLITEAECGMHANRVRPERTSACSCLRELRFDDLTEVVVRCESLDLLSADKEGGRRLHASGLASLVVCFDERTRQVAIHAVAPRGHRD